MDLHYSIITALAGATIVRRNMSPKDPKRAREVCPRCRLDIVLNARRCPHCGEHLVAANRFAIYIGIVGVLALMFMGLVMLQGIHREDQDAAPAFDSDDRPAADAGTPDKPPPLNK
jgi:hypothetical protein